MAFMRLKKDLRVLHEADLKYFRQIYVYHTNILCWEGLLLPESPPFNNGAFKLLIKFPTNYPFKPPVIRFLTKIYHPYFCEEGAFCESANPVIGCENWNPAVNICQVFESLLNMLNELPREEHTLCPELLEEYRADRNRFFKNAEEFTEKFAEKRPIHCECFKFVSRKEAADLFEEYQKDREKFKNTQEFVLKFAEKHPQFIQKFEENFKETEKNDAAEKRIFRIKPKMIM